jgi:hypothetical protein
MGGAEMKMVRPPFLKTLVFVAIMLINLVPLTGSADSDESVEQERTLCIEECRRLYWPLGTEAWRQYYRCLDNCEKDFWKQWNKNMGELDKD